MRVLHVQKRWRNPPGRMGRRPLSVPAARLTPSERGPRLLYGSPRCLGAASCGGFRREEGQPGRHMRGWFMNNVGLPIELHRACPPARVTPGFGSTPFATSSGNGPARSLLSAPAVSAMGRCSANAATGCPVQRMSYPLAPRAAHGRLCAPCQRRPESVGPGVQNPDGAWRCGVRRAAEPVDIRVCGRDSV